jgi:transposase
MRLKASVAPRPAPAKSAIALRVVTPLLEEPVADRPNWTIARLRAEIEAREGVRISRSQLSRALRKKVPLAATPAHGEGAPDRQRGGSDRLAPATAQASGRSRRHRSSLRRRERGLDASLSRLSRRGVRHLPGLSGRRSAPDFAQLVEENGPIHLSKLSLAALAARSHWLTVVWLSKYAPELNDIEVVWRDLKTYHLAHQTFTHVDALDRAIHAAVHSSTVSEAPFRRPTYESLLRWRPITLEPRLFRWASGLDARSARELQRRAHRVARGANQSAARRGVGPNVGPRIESPSIDLIFLEKLA